MPPNVPPLRPASAPRRVSPPAVFYEKRRGQVELGRSMQGDLQKVYVFVDVDGAGEALVDVNFPVAFADEPATSFGGKLAPNQVLEDGNFPTVSVLVKEYETTRRGNRDYPTGATLILVVGGPRTQRMTVCWQAEGLALVNPISDEDIP